MPVTTISRGGTICLYPTFVKIIIIAKVAVKVDLYDLVIFDHFWPSDRRGNRDEI